MRLFLVSRIDRIGYDEVAGFVVASETNHKARVLASENAADEGSGVWLDGYKTYCTMIAGECQFDTPQIILTDFNAG